MSAPGATADQSRLGSASMASLDDDFLLTSGIDPSYVHVCAASNSVRGLSDFVERLMGAATSRSEGSKPGWASCERLRSEQLVTLLNSADRRERQNGRTPLHHATIHCHHRMVKYLLDMGVDVTLTDESDKTPLYYSVQEVLLKLRQMQQKNSQFLTRTR